MIVLGCCFNVFFKFKVVLFKYSNGPGNTPEIVFIILDCFLQKR